MFRFGRLEFWYTRGVWCRPSEWVFGISYCYNGCMLVELGFCGFTILRGDCAKPLTTESE